MAPEPNIQASAPGWLRKLGFTSWLLVGFVLVIVGAIWLLGQTSTIVMPVILANELRDRRAGSTGVDGLPRGAPR